jgi:hypothetical protein
VDDSKANRRRTGLKCMYDVFISCSGKDYDKAERLQNELNLQDVSAFVAKTGIHYADNFEKFLRKAIDNSSVFVVLLSVHVTQKPENVEKELYWAERTNKKILPFVIDSASIDEDIAFHLGKRHRIEATDGAWEDKIEEVIASIHEALGSSPVLRQASTGTMRRLWRRARREFLVWRRKATAIFVAAIFAALLIVAVVGWSFRDNLSELWNRLFPQKIPVAAVVLTADDVTPVNAYWTDNGDIHSEPLEPPIDSVAMKLKLVTEFARPESETTPFANVSVRRGQRAASGELESSFQKMGLAKTDLQWFLKLDGEQRSDTAEPRTSIEQQAIVLTGVGTALAAAFSKADNGNVAPSWVILHFNRERCLVAWQTTASSGKNYWQWFDKAELTTLKGSTLATNAKEEDEKRTGIMSNKIVCLCGEIPALAIRSQLQKTLRTAQTPHTQYDASEPADHLPWLIYFNDRDVSKVKQAFGSTITKQSIAQDVGLLFPILKDGTDAGEALKAIDDDRKRLAGDVIDALEIDQGDRIVIVAPFIF